MNKEKLLPVGTKVFDARFGWGEVKEGYEGVGYPLEVFFKKDNKTAWTSYTLDGRLFKEDLTPSLSLTEYDYVNGGFTPISEYKGENNNVDTAKKLSKVFADMIKDELGVKVKFKVLR